MAKRGAIVKLAAAQSRALKLDIVGRRVSAQELQSVKNGRIARVAIAARHPDFDKVLDAARASVDGARDRVVIVSGDSGIAAPLLLTLAMANGVRYLAEDAVRKGALSLWLAGASAPERVAIPAALSAA